LVPDNDAAHLQADFRATNGPGKYGIVLPGATATSNLLWAGYFKLSISE
jgi:hypothetical protein